MNGYMYERGFYMLMATESLAWLAVEGRADESSCLH